MYTATSLPVLLLKPYKNHPTLAYQNGAIKFYQLLLFSTNIQIHNTTSIPQTKWYSKIEDKLFRNSILFRQYL